MRTHPILRRVVLTAMLASAVACKTETPEQLTITTYSREVLTDTGRTTERLIVSGPFSARLERADGSLALLTSETKVIKDQTSGGGALTPTTSQLVRHDRKPDPVENSEASIADALEQGAIVAGDGSRKTADGGSCGEVLSVRPLDDGVWAPPSAGSSVSSCIDAKGRVLLEIWTLGDRVVRQRTMKRIVHGAIEPAEFEAHPQVLEVDAELRVRRVTLPAGPFAFAFPTPPDEMTELLLATIDIGVRPDYDETGERWMFSGQSGIVWLEQRDLADPEALYVPPKGTPIEVASLPGAVVTFSTAGTTIHARVADVLIEVGGTSPLDDLVAWAATFEPL